MKLTAAAHAKFRAQALKEVLKAAIREVSGEVLE